MTIASCIALAACSNAPSDDAPDYEVDLTSGGERPAPSSDTGPRETKGDETLTPEPTAPAGGDGTAEKAPPSTPYGGTLAATTKVAFGGGNYCNYDVTLRDVALDVTMTAANEVTAATMKDRVVEGAPGCQYPPMKPADQSFTLKAQSAITGGTRLTFTGAATNQPKTDLVVDLVAKGEGYEASATWKRVDQTGSLAWTVRAKVALARK